MFDWLKKLFRRKKLVEPEKPCGEVVGREGLYFLHKGEPIYNPKTKFNRTIIVPKSGHQATRQDISKFMRHGKQSSLYRKSVKSKVKPEDD